MRCLCCMKNSNKNYCPSCVKDFYDGNSFETLEFDKNDFVNTRIKLIGTSSISGVRDKISLGFNEKKKLIPTALNGKYILKPQPNTSFKHASDFPANEHLSMHISSSIFKIDTAKSALIRFSDGEFAYITKRFDYSDERANIKELLQEKYIKYDLEDFSSVLNITSENRGKNYKYESSYEDISIAIDKYVSASRVAQENFLRRVIFNFLISNGNTHLKNFSLMRIGKEMKLSPSYDLLNTKIHANDTEMSLALFKDKESLYNIEEFSKRQGIKNKRFSKIMQEIESYTPKVEKMVEDSFLSEQMKELYIKMYKNNLNIFNQ